MSDLPSFLTQQDSQVWARINLNQLIRFRVNEPFRARVCDNPYFEPLPDGRYEAQLWCFMREFGNDFRAFNQEPVSMNAEVAIEH